MKGIFYFKNKDGFKLLRFYESGLVFDVSINEITSLNKIKWFNQNNYKPFWGKGNYLQTKDKIEFISSSISGNIVYRGQLINEDEIEFEIESQINGYKSKRHFKRLLKLPDKEEQENTESEKITNDENYPIVLIPQQIIESIKREITKAEIYKNLGIEVPVIQKLKNPSRPQRYKYIDVEKTKYEGSLIEAIAIIPMIIFFIAVAVKSLEKNNVGVFFLFLIMSIFLIKYIWKFRTSKDVERVDIADNVYNQQIEDYNKEVELVKIKNAEYEKQYFKELNSIDKKIKNQIEEVKQEIYYQSLKPFCGLLEKKENVKRGKTELMFLSHLIEKYGRQILVDCFLDLPYQNYQPDFILKCEITGVHIDIEIDEPYSFSEKEAIHFVGADDVRNQSFLEQNWCIIRFSEKQIIQQTKKCIDLIDNVLSSIRDKVDIKRLDIEKDKKWTYEEALVMSHKNARNEY